MTVLRCPLCDEEVARYGDFVVDEFALEEASRLHLLKHPIRRRINRKIRRAFAASLRSQKKSA